MLKLSLHPQGLAPRIANLSEWRAHLLERLRQQISATGDPVLIRLLEELSAYPAPAASRSTAPDRDFTGIAVPLELDTVAGQLSFLSTTTVFGTPVDVTLSELAIESFFPANPQTAEALKAMLPGR